MAHATLYKLARLMYEEGAIECKLLEFGGGPKLVLLFSAIARKR
jgi:hypothetical protein